MTPLSCPVLSQGCDFSAGLEKDRPVWAMKCTPRTRGSPPQPDPLPTQHRRWRPPQKTRSAALRHTVRSLLSNLSFVVFSDCCISILVRMVVFVVVQVCGRPNQRTWSRVRLCLRYQTLLCTVPLTKHKTLCSFDCSEISCMFVGCSFGSVCLTVGILSPAADGPLKQR